MEQIRHEMGVRYGPGFWSDFEDAIHGLRPDLNGLLYQDLPTALLVAVGTREPQVAQQLDWMAMRLDILAGYRGAEVPRVLDVGAGSGVAAAFLAARGALVLAIDPQPEATSVIEEVAAYAGVDSVVAACRGLTDCPALLGLNQVDVVVMQELLTSLDLEHAHPDGLDRRTGMIRAWRDPEPLNPDLAATIAAVGEHGAELWIMDHPLCPELWVSIASMANRAGLQPLDLARFEWQPMGGDPQVQYGLGPLAPFGAGPTGEDLVDVMLARGM